MRLKRPDHSDRWRVAVFVAVLGLHVLAGLLLFATGTIRIGHSRADAPLSLLWLPPQTSQRVTVPSAAAAPERSLKRRDAARKIDQPSVVTPPVPGNAITLPLDVRADADAAARRQSDKDENERRWRNLAGPSDSQLEWSRNNAPLIRDHRQLGDDERKEGGELITWVNDKCYYTTQGVTTFGMPQTSKLCKDPFKPKTDLFKDMRKKLDDGATRRAP